MNTKKILFLFKIVLFLVNYQECYFVFIEFEYYIKLFVWMMKTSSGCVCGGVTYFLVLSICTENMGYSFGKIK